LSKFLPSAADKIVDEAPLSKRPARPPRRKRFGIDLGVGSQSRRIFVGTGAPGDERAGDADAAMKYLDQISIVADERKEADRLIARLKLQSGAAENEAALREKVKAAPKDLAARFELAQALAAVEKYEEALQEFLAVVKADRGFQDDAGRKSMLQIFEVLGSDHPFTDRYRSELAAVLFR
jgi:tetratricopeptide (TPR) repeat protein